MKTGIFGGSFNPPTLAHVHLAQRAADDVHLDRVLFIPVGNATHKQMSDPGAEHRLQMTQLAIEHDPRLVLSRCEIDRTGPSYMIDTIRYLQKEHPGDELYLIIGQDQAVQFHQWKDCAEILERIHGLVVHTRPPCEPTAIYDALVSLSKKVPVVLETEMDVSSTELRLAIANDQYLPAKIDKAVFAYAQSHSLYTL